MNILFGFPQLKFSCWPTCK